MERTYDGVEILFPELSLWRCCKFPIGLASPPVASIQWAEFLDSGIAMLGASADADAVPEASRVWGATHDGESGTLRVLVDAAAGRTLETVQDGARIALVLTDIVTFRSYQVKGAASGAAAPAGPTDIAVLRRYDERFSARLHEIGHPDALVERLRPISVFVLTIAIEHVFDQTPGPGAGAILEGER